MSTPTLSPEQLKAKELIEKFGAFEVPVFDSYWYEWKDESMNYEQAKESAIIAVKEIIEVQNDFYGLVLTPKFRDRVRKRVEYWESVLKHLEAL